MDNAKIKLTGNTLENIKTMAPHLSKKQQQVVYGMILGMTVQNEVDRKLAGSQNEKEEEAS
mgnify:FL=1